MIKGIFKKPESLGTIESWMSGWHKQILTDMGQQVAYGKMRDLYQISCLCGWVGATSFVPGVLRENYWQKHLFSGTTTIRQAYASQFQEIWDDATMIGHD